MYASEYITIYLAGKLVSCIWDIFSPYSNRISDYVITTPWSLR